MTDEVLAAALLIAIGAFFAIHCYRAGRRELRTGIAKGRFRDYPRESPWFWPTIAATFTASIMGAIFFICGCWFAVALLLRK